jgi:hypothetical protein
MLPDPSVWIADESLFKPFDFKLFKLAITSEAFAVVPLVRVVIVAPNIPLGMIITPYACIKIPV